MATALVVASAGLLSGAWRAGIFEAVPRTTQRATGEPVPEAFQPFNDLDSVIASWLVSRNADTLLRAPAHLFDAEQCAPATMTLAFGEPMLTLGALAIPWRVITNDAVATYNLTLFSLFVVSALAMYALVLDWTDSWPAAAGAAILYAFNAERVANLAHPFIYDTTWIVLSMYFARRWLSMSRWRDALGLALSGAMQLGTSFYPILASALVAVPVGASMIRAAELRRLRAVQAGAIVVIVAGLAYVVFSPYLAVRASSDSLRRTSQVFAAWSWLLPHREAGVTWSAIILSVVALIRLRDSTGRRIPSWSIALGGFLAAAAATGPNQPEFWTQIWGGRPPFQVPDLYAALARFLPGVDSVRAPARIDVGFITASSLLAGIGLSRMIQIAGRYKTVMAIVLVVAIAAETWNAVGAIRPTDARGSFLRIAPDQDDLRFFDTLAAMGNTGPLLELPLGDRDREYVLRSPERVLMSAYHHRRTSACYASFLPPGRDYLRAETLRLPASDTVEHLCNLGFTTALIHLDTNIGRFVADNFHVAAREVGGRVRYLAENAHMSAFALCDATHDN